MTPELTLFLLRVFSAVLLLSFLSLVIWFLYQDIRVGRVSMSSRTTGLGRLRVIANPGDYPASGDTFELSPISTIGRDGRNTIVLDDGYISGEHALISWRDSKWWLEDLGSRNGTYLNDIPLQEAAVISTGDIVKIGNIQLKLEAGPIGEGGSGISGIRDSNP